jgi:outer membrane autotransporter protein
MMVSSKENLKKTLGHKSPYYDKNGNSLCLGDDVTFNGRPGYQIRIRDDEWVICPVGALCYHPIEDNKYANKKGMIKKVGKTNSITMTGGLMCQELVR